MYYIFKKDLFSVMKKDLLEQIIENEEIYDICEKRAIDICSNYLSARYDTAHEFRPYTLYNFNEVYSDNQRVLCAYNTDNQSFAEEWNIELIDKNVTEDEFSYFLLNKKKNTCASKYNNAYARLDNVNNSQSDVYSRTASIPYQTPYNVENEEYNESCGFINTTSGLLQTNNIYNLFNSIYTTAGIVNINYNEIGLEEARLYYNNLDNFDQYLYSNYSRDFENDDRCVSLVAMICDLMIYEILTTCSPRDMSQTHEYRYNNTMKMLDDIARGRSTINLRKKEYAVAEQVGAGFRWGNSFSFQKNNY